VILLFAGIVGIGIGAGGFALFFFRLRGAKDYGPRT
jgi:hypothetical protein